MKAPTPSAFPWPQAAVAEESRRPWPRFVPVEEVKQLPEYLQAIHDDCVFELAADSSGPLSLIYTFEGPFTFGGLIREDGETHLPIRDTEARRVIRETLAVFEAAAGLSFSEVGAERSDSATLVFRYARNMSAEIAGYAYLPCPGLSSFPISFREGSVTKFLVAHEVMHSLGGKHPHELGSSGVVLPLAPAPGSNQWQDHPPSTVLTYQRSRCYVPDLGVLDRALLLHLYGAGAPNVGNDTYQVDGQRPIVTIGDPAGYDRLVVNAPHMRVRITLKTGPTDVSEIGQALVLVAPGTILEELDMQHTSGGFAQGNEANNVIFGSDADDVVDGGGGEDVVTTGGGHDVVFVTHGQKSVYVTDFDRDKDRVEIERGDVEVAALKADVVQKDGRRVVCLTLPDGSTILLGGTFGAALESLPLDGTVSIARRSPPRLAAEIFACDLDNLAGNGWAMWATVALSATAAFILGGAVGVCLWLRKSDRVAPAAEMTAAVV